jgi:hypothetical protein
MIHEFNNPIPVTTKSGAGYLWYVSDSGLHENDVYTVILKKGGRVIHCSSEQIRVNCNSTFDITKDTSI